MTCHMGEFTRSFLWSSCDQCGVNIEIEYTRYAGNGGRLLDKWDTEALRDQWNKWHRRCSAAKGIKVPRFTHDRDDLITYV